MNTIRLLLLALTTLTVTSCGGFGEAFLMGLGNTGGYGGYGGGYIAPSGGGNMDYLLDPNYAAAQTMAQQQQYNQVFNNIAQQTVNQVSSMEEKEYENFCKYNKKPDGSNYTKSEWLAFKAQAIQNMNTGGGAAVFSTGATSGTINASGMSSFSQIQNSTSSSTQQTRHNCPLCNGQRRIVKDTYPSLFGTSDYKVRCNECGGYFMRSTGHTHITCPQCHGKGYFSTN